MIRHSLFLAGVVAMFCSIMRGCGDPDPSTDKPLCADRQAVVRQDLGCSIALHSGDTIRGIYFLDGRFMC